MQLITDIWPRTTDYSDFLDEAPQPNDPMVLAKWRRILERCIYGCWGHVGDGKYRYMTPYMYFYINWFVIQHIQRTASGAASTTYMRPKPFDFVWTRFAYLFACYGFAGFEGDRYACCPSLLTERPDERWRLPDGTYRTYMPPLQLLLMDRDAIPQVTLPDGTTRPARPMYGPHLYNDLLVGTRGGGKALRHGTPVLTPDGWVPIEQLKVGDTVMGRKDWCKVTAVHPQGRVHMFRVYFFSGRHIDTCAHHQWLVRNRNGADLVVTTKDLWQHPFSFYCHMPRLDVDIPVDLKRRQRFTDEETFFRLLAAGYYAYDNGYGEFVYVPRRRLDPIIGAIPLYERDEATCIEVDDPDHVFVTKDYILTHNSYTTASIIEHNFIFGGARELDEAFFEERYRMDQLVGSGDQYKVQSLLDKFKLSLDAKARVDAPFDSWFGTREVLVLGRSVIEPSFLYRNYIGDLKSNSKNPMRAARIKGDREVGTKSTINVVIYSPNKKSAAQSAAGGRFGFAVIEEAGITPDLHDIFRSNVATMERMGRRFGVCSIIGTSGNLEMVGPLLEMFHDPDRFDILAVETPFGRHGLFLPVYMTWEDCKDEHGNTIWEKVEQRLKSWKRRLDELTPADRVSELLNYPVVPDDMGGSGKTTVFDVPALRERLTTLTAARDQPVTGYFSGGAFVPDDGLEVVTDETQFYKMAARGQYGCVALYEPPLRDRSGNVVGDAYVFVVDPYTQGSLDYKGSIGVTYVVKLPRHWEEGKQVIVASYIAKPYGGIEEYHQQLLYLVHYYGAPQQSVFFEDSTAAAGIRTFFLLKNMEHLLAPRPFVTGNNRIAINNITRYGFPSPAGSRERKFMYASQLHEFLARKVGKEQRVYDTIRDRLLLRQLAMWEPDGNFDAVSAAMGIPIAVKEKEYISERVSSFSEDIAAFLKKRL